MAQARIGQFIVGPALRGLHHADLALLQPLQVPRHGFAQGQAIVAQPVVRQAGMAARGVQGALGVGLGMALRPQPGEGLIVRGQAELDALAAAADRRRQARGLRADQP